MVLGRQIAPNKQRSHAKVYAALQAIAKSGGTAVLIVPSFAVATRYRKEWAEERFSFGLTITTFAAWISDRWDLFGDGRRIITTVQRNLLLHHVLSEAISDGVVSSVTLSPGTVRMLASMAQEALPILIDEDSALPTEEALTEAEIEVCEVLRRYAQSLDHHGLCETAQVLQELSHAKWPTPPVLFEGIDSFTPSESSFIEALGKRVEVGVYSDDMTLPVKVEGRAEELVDLQLCLFDPDPNDPVRPTGAVRFLLPSGRYAKPLLIGQNLVEYVSEGDKMIAVAAARPESLFFELAPYLSVAGINAGVSAQKHFSETDFGVMLISLIRFMFAPRYSSFELSDVILSSFSDIALSRAYEIDTMLRGDRTIDKERSLALLVSASPFFSSLIEALEKEEFGEALVKAEAYAKDRFSWSEAYRSEQLVAIGVGKAFFEAMGSFRVDLIEALPLLEKSTVNFSASTNGGSKAASQIYFMSYGALAEEDPCSFDTVLVCDLDTQSYPIRDHRDAKTRLFSKLGILDEEDALYLARRQFFRMLSVPKRSFVCERTLNTVDANAAYAAVMLEELLDCYCRDLLSQQEIDQVTGMPKVLLSFVERAGEDELYRNAAVVDAPQGICAHEALMPPGVISEVARSKIVLPHQGRGIVEGDALSLSPSAVESYLECPYKWFSLRRLRLSEPDAGFGSLEMGSFAHRLLKSFYLCFQKQSGKKVDPGNLDDAKTLLAELFDQHIEFQPDLKRKENPLIALSALEKEEVLSLKKRMLRYLDREAQLLPGFSPRYFEYDFGDDEVFRYAGATLHGSIDRIDVNEKGQAVVIDYKGSVSSEYAFESRSEVPWAAEQEPEKPLSLPNKVQALLYAQAARKLLGLDVVGALYVSYGRDGRVSGVYDSVVLATKDLLDIDRESCEIPRSQYPGFGEMLDEVEAAIAPTLERLAKGHIAPYPRGKDPCAFCPVTACEVRKRV